MFHSPFEPAWRRPERWTRRVVKRADGD